MVLDALRGYAQLANGLSDVTRQRAAQAARQLVDQGGGLLVGVTSSSGSAEFARQVQGLAEDILATGRTNRDLLVGLIRTEVERAVARLGLVGADELSAMARVVERLQSQLDAAIAFGGKNLSDGPAAPSADEPGPTPAGRRSARRGPVTFAGPSTASAAAPAAKKVAKKAAKRPAKKAAKTATKKPAQKPTANPVEEPPVAGAAGSTPAEPGAAQDNASHGPEA
jgi:hypothetical protein